MKFKEACKNMEDMKVIDGSIMEGGGQVLRMAVSLSCLLEKPIKITNIRGGRSKPGLKGQHLAGLRLVSEMCSGRLTGDAIDSTEITFRPGRVTGGSYSAETGTAGSVGLLLQVSLPCAMFASAPTRLTLRGGTNAAFAPQIDYTLNVFRPLLERFGGNLQCDVRRRGYFPRGGGLVEASVSPVTQLRPLELLDQGRLVGVTGAAFVAGKLPLRVADSVAAAARRRLQAALPSVPVRVEAVRDPEGAGPASGLNLVAETDTGCRLGGSALGGRGATDDQVAATATDELLRAVSAGACVDQYCQDQCVILMALAAGRSRIRTVKPTLHTETAIHIAERLTQAKFSVEKCDSESGDSYIIECEGIGHCRDRQDPET
ncbi:RNA 3'-terminal phosphate cyclase-like isoform X3 [Amphibalanus amphitrite]|uniref:RNA 3'-terminal phosphate cyclase-like isoform X3 n=1 Tax=Amphibalanus amphitrite TaxID=1232801 RepID=UPI001C907B09|nr:RNA 3'-terminal phosphate cyclase-like isoform X3 [Amphibalanus amphitrite]